MSNKSAMAGHARLRKYQIRYVAGYWIARVPYGTWRRFDTWSLACLWLRTRHEERMIEAEKRARRERSEEHTSELQSLMRISYAVFCLKNKIKEIHSTRAHTHHTTTNKPQEF